MTPEKINLMEYVETAEGAWLWLYLSDKTIHRYQIERPVMDSLVERLPA